MTDGRPETFPELVTGFGSVTKIPDIVQDGAWTSALIVCGKQSFEGSGAARILDSLDQVARVERWSEFEPNAAAGALLEGLEVLHDTDPDVVIGIGGGSAMDLAKLLCAFDGIREAGALESAITSGNQLHSRRRGLILAPTTSGSGSEATHFSTVYLAQAKYSVFGEGLRPDAVILDPELSLSASRYQKATSGIDAVAQAIESLWARAATPASRRFARRALRYLLPSIEDFVHEASSDSATAMSTGSHLAGRAIDISRTTAAHALSYSITQKHGVSHGHAVALTLGQFLEAHTETPPARLQTEVDSGQHSRVMKEILAYLGADDGADARRRFVDLMERLGLTTTLSGVGVTTSEQRAAIAASVNPERMSNNPVSFDEIELLSLLEDSA